MTILWTEKYRPKNLSEVLSQDRPIKEALDFVSSFKKGKALLFAGQPGTGKTLAAELIAKEKNCQLVGVNASDKRSAGEIEAAFSEVTKNKPLFWNGRIILIDEVDGIAPVDRGAAAAIAKVIKESAYPVILVANDAYAPKLKDLRKYCKIIKFAKVHALSIAKKLREIAALEGIKIGPEIAPALAKWSSGDMRSALIDFQVVSAGKQEVVQEDMEILGYRERLADVFGVLPSVFFSGSMAAGRKAIGDSDKDADEIFWWAETNIPKVFKESEGLAAAYDLLAKADILRGRVQKQQNWRFRAYMSDMLAGISVCAKANRSFVMFQPPDRFIQMGATKAERAGMAELGRKLGRALHCSSETVRKDYLPYLRVAAGKDEKFLDSIGISEEEKELF